MYHNDSFKRFELLIGNSNMEKAKNAKIILFGVGGVGSWCAEALVRSGFEFLTLVDFDDVCITNINRQLMATTQTIGKKKVEIMRDRLLDINPNAKIEIIEKIYSAENSNDFKLDSYNYVIDAIDSISNKIHLIEETINKTKATLFSSMGAALKLDPTKVKVAEFWKVNTCPMASFMRRKMRKDNNLSRKFLCVYSDEQQTNSGKEVLKQIVGKSIDSSGKADETLAKKGMPNGTSIFVTATFGLTLASLVIKDIIGKDKN